MKIVTDNLVIREFTLDDAGAYFKNNNEAQIKKYMPNHWHGDENEAYQEIEGFLSDYQDMKISCHFAVTKDDALIGHVGIGESDVSDDIYEICYAINEENRGFGYAAEAVRAFVPWCKAAFGIDKIYASTNPENIASYKSLLNAGFAAADEKNNLYVSI